jgi:RND superfamily putative drug exporter
MLTQQTASTAPSRSRRERLVILLWLAVVLGGVLAGTVVFDRLSTATDPAPGSESQRARRSLQAATGERDTVLAVVTGTTGEAAEALADRLRQVPGVHRVRTSTDLELPPPTGGGVTVAVGLSAGRTDQQVNTTVDAVRTEFDRVPAGEVVVGGYPVLDRELGQLARADLARAEAIALPIVLILLGLAVRSAIGALLGLALTLTTVTGALILLLALSGVTEVSSFAVNIVTMFGIGLAVDYGLLIITRFQRERADGRTVADAVAAATATSGRTVALSAFTVAIALAGLLVFAEPVVRSMAYGGIGAVAVAAASALTLLPALLRRVGHRIPARAPRPGGGFTRLARAVQWRPGLVALAGFGILVTLALPIRDLTIQGVDARSLPADASARRDSHELEQRLPLLAGAPITIVASVPATDPRLPGYLGRIRGIGHVTAATVRPDPSGGLTAIDVAVDGPAGGRDAIGVVDRIRDSRPDFDVAVTGLTARFNDFIGGLTARAPYALLLIALATYLVLLLSTGSYLIAAKAVVMNLVSLAASIGALVWIFQHGNLAGPLQFTSTGGLSLVIIVLTAVFAFGLSTDYEVFLLASIMAARRRGLDTNIAVATGVAQTGRIITVAALLIVVVFTGFSAGNVLIIKQLGLGLAIAVLIDASIARLALTPAVMTLLGRHIWIGPAWAQRTSRSRWRHEAQQ